MLSAPEANGREATIVSHWLRVPQSQHCQHLGWTPLLQGLREQPLWHTSPEISIAAFLKTHSFLDFLYIIILEETVQASTSYLAPMQTAGSTWGTEMRAAQQASRSFWCTNADYSEEVCTVMCEQ